MRKFAFLLLALVLVSACQETLEERAAREARAYTEKNCPAQLSDYIVIDSMTFDAQTRTFCYDYRFMGLMDTTAHDSAAMYDELRANMKNATALKVYKDAGYRFRYVYRSQKNPEVILFQAEFGEGDY